MRDIEPSEGDVRVHSWYAWWPVYVGKEMRWLEQVTCRQVWCMNPEEMGFGYEWFSVEFL